MELSEQRAYYDRRWTSAYLDELDSHQAARLAAIGRVLRLVERPRPWRVLEVGCGIGWLAGALATYGPVTGLDLSEAGVAIARERHPEVTFRVADVLTEPVAPDHDLVVSSEVIEHVPEQALFVERLADAVRPGGYVLVTTPNGRVESRWRRRTDYDPQPIERWLEPRALRRLLARRCRVLAVTTFFYDFDRDGVYGLVHDARFERTVGRLGLAEAVNRLLGRLGLGLYTIALARRRH